jgi:hypothetical protein
MKISKMLPTILFLLICMFSADAGLFHQGASADGSSGRSELVLNTPSAGEFPFLNLFKTATQWNYGDNTNVLGPTELDSNGYPLFGGGWSSHTGAKVQLTSPSQAERPGHYVFTWTGAQVVSIYRNGDGATSTVSCTGRRSGGCDNRGCSTFTGSISATTLMVAAPPTGLGCALGAGVPITGSGVKISKFGTPTIITTAGSVCGSNTCYTVNQSQTVGSETMRMGGRYELSTVDATATNAQWNILEASTVSGNQASNFAFFHIGDETAYWSSAAPCGKGEGCIIGSMLKMRIQQANLAVLRDLDWTLGNISNCTTWATRKPIMYSSYTTSEMRNAASGAGQFVNSSGSGASGGTVRYSADTDVYSITLGSGGPVDKQTILMAPPANGTISSKISINGTGAVPILTGYGAPLANGFGAFIPQSANITTVVYDAVLGGFLNYGGSLLGSLGLNCGVPPEVFVEINAEVATTPWHVPGPMALDPMTDWIKQYATYIKTNYASMKPIFEASNEPWNCAGGPYNPQYFSAKSFVYIHEDPAWKSGYFCGAGGNLNSEVGKVASTMGQDLTTVYGAGNFELLVPVQTSWNGSATFNDTLRSSAYINQTIAPTQPGYTQTAAYKYVTRVSIANYWNTGNYNAQSEAAVGYCYYFYSISSGCQGFYVSQAAVLQAKMATATSGINTFSFFAKQWNAWASTCSLRSRPADCTVNANVPLMYYEGGYSEDVQATDIIGSIPNISNAPQAVLTLPGNGCAPGQPVVLANLGGAWASANGSYTVVSATADTCAINLNSVHLGPYGNANAMATGNTSIGGGVVKVASCSGIVSGLAIFDVTTNLAVGTVRSFAPCTSGQIALEVAAVNPVFTGDNLLLSAGTITYTGSADYVTQLRMAGYLSPDLDTYTTNLFNIIAANGGINPSQYHLANIYGIFGGNPWLVFGFDVYGYFTLGQCTACTISGSTLTLGGKIKGVFGPGQTLFGAGVTGIGTGASSNTTITSCMPVGANVCGTRAGDTLGLSQPSTVSSGVTMTGNATPPTNNARNSTTSPVRAWGAICRWNGNGNQCNG